MTTTDVDTFTLAGGGVDDKGRPRRGVRDDENHLREQATATHPTKTGPGSAADAEDPGPIGLRN